jgi:hypothetical protein
MAPLSRAVHLVGMGLFAVASVSFVGLGMITAVLAASAERRRRAGATRGA